MILRDKNHLFMIIIYILLKKINFILINSVNFSYKIYEIFVFIIMYYIYWLMINIYLIYIE